MTATSDRMKEIVDSIAPDLKSAGFRRRRFSFNRTQPDGTIHEVWFWMGAYDPSGKHGVPGFLPDLHGTFTIRIGVHLPSMTRMGVPKSDWITDAYCQVRWPIDALLPGKRSMDWNLADPAAGESARFALFGPGLAKLDELPDVDSVLARFDRDGWRALGVNPSIGLDIAEVYNRRGDTKNERRVLTDYIQAIVDKGGSPGHEQIVERWVTQLGHPDLAQRLISARELRISAGG